VKEITGDIWDFHAQGHWIVITTNRTVKSNGEAVMGKGIALQAKQRYPVLARELGKTIVIKGNVPSVFWRLGIISFPVKYNWRERASLDLIESSCSRLLEVVRGIDIFKAKTYPYNQWPEEIYMVRPGCGAGGLDWKDVKPILEKYLDDRFVVVEKKGD